MYHVFTRDLAQRCEALGVRFIFGTTIRGFEHSADQMSSVITEEGRIDGDEFVLALVCQSPILGRKVDFRLPIYLVKGYSLTLPIDAGHAPPTLGGVDENNLVAWARYGNFLLNSGHGHMSWTMACGTARIVSDTMLGRSPELKLDGFTLH